MTTTPTAGNYSIAQYLKSPIAIINEQGRIEWRNTAFENAFGSGALAFLQEAARAVAGERGWLQGFFLSGADQWTTDVDLAGRTYRVDKIRNVDEYPTPGVALWFEDVTEQRQAEQAKSDFTAQIVHDLRGPLSGIQGTLEFVLSQEGNKIDSMYTDLLNEAQHESERMMNLINEILDFSKIQSGKFSVEKEPVRVAGLLKRAIRSLQSVDSRMSLTSRTRSPSASSALPR
jgi:signal transduction histidine kinase